MRRPTSSSRRRGSSERTWLRTSPARCGRIRRRSCFRLPCPVLPARVPMADRRHQTPARASTTGDRHDGRTEGVRRGLPQPIGPAAPTSSATHQCCRPPRSRPGGRRDWHPVVVEGDEVLGQGLLGSGGPPPPSTLSSNESDPIGHRFEIVHSSVPWPSVIRRRREGQATRPREMANDPAYLSPRMLGVAATLRHRACRAW